MKTYARIYDGKVAELFKTDGDINKLFHPDLVWVECGNSSASVGWYYANGTFSAPDAENLNSAKGRMLESIKYERDRRTEQGGYKVGTKWFHSDQTSRSQQLGLVLLGINIPANLQWKTMDGSFVTMTQLLAGQVLAAAAASDQAVFAAAETHRAAMEASGDPASYDYSGGWPKVYGE